MLISFLISLLSCGITENKKGTDLISSVSTEYDIVTIVKIDGIAWFSRMREGVFQFADETGMNCTFSGPSQSRKELQVELIEKAISDRVDAICIVPFDIEAVEPALKKARDAGIVVIAHEASTLENTDLIIEAFDNREYGEHLMDSLASLMEEEGEYIVFVGSYGSETHMEWATAAVERQKKLYPNMKVYGDWIECFDEQAIIYTETIDVLKKNPKIKGILGAPMPTAPGAGIAVESLGLTDSVSIVSTSLVSVSSEQLKDDSVDLISFWDPYDAGYIMNLLAVFKLENMDIYDGMNFFVPGYESIRRDISKKNLYFGSSWTDVTKANMDEYDF